jgi:hypothetical protein
MCQAPSGGCVPPLAKRVETLERLMVLTFAVLFFVAVLLCTVVMKSTSVQLLLQYKNLME